MKFSLATLLILPLISISIADASPRTNRQQHARGVSSQKQQTSRDEINARAHLQETRNLVQLNDKRAGGTVSGLLKPRASRRAEITDLSIRSPNSITKRRLGRASERERERELELESQRERERGRRPKRPSQHDYDLESQVDSKKIETEQVVDTSFRNVYPRCGSGSKRRTGYARYQGWKILGDDLSGGVPVHPELSCVMACNKYGGSCSGVFFDGVARHCFLKGTHTASWTFVESDDAEGVVDLIGGCAIWAGIVPDEMDAICCRD